MVIIITGLKNSINKHTHRVMMGAEGGLKKCLRALGQKGKKMAEKALHRSARCKGTRNMVFWIKVLI